MCNWRKSGGSSTKLGWPGKELGRRLIWVVQFGPGKVCVLVLLILASPGYVISIE